MSTSLQLPRNCVLHVPPLNAFAALPCFKHLLRLILWLHNRLITWFSHTNCISLLMAARDFRCWWLFCLLTDNTHPNDHIFQFVNLRFQKTILISKWKNCLRRRSRLSKWCGQTDLSSELLTRYSCWRMSPVAFYLFHLTNKFIY